MIRTAGPGDAAEVARLLDAFNREFDTPTPGPDVLEARLRPMLDTPDTVAFLAGERAIGLALVTYRPNVWHDGPVALLDELYVRPDYRDQGIGTELVEAIVAHAVTRACRLVEVNVDEGDGDALRFYARHGFALLQPDTGERALYLAREVR
ncbi:GNAT family N-acetyltransferase [Demequina sp. SYSU T00192]|uniref:GNAT family N-acetyltransferase n=1 Tax=Demequina litoralis TaxID=3051660 RepID=A0ABT8GAS8_9MICO|nr:GNAT family N-acetyltransferase [Demequina sp. SYSU T00192]MDN4476246.1 GNAT family N-acetyltransferase [Demequina sp. SYSU T00192]